MTKSDLRTGMVLEYRCGKRAMVLLDTIVGDCRIGNDDNCYSLLSYINEDLTNEICGNYDIIKIYEPKSEIGLLEKNWDEATLIWERTSDVELTVTINGKEAKLSDLSEETLLNLRKNN